MLHRKTKNKGYDCSAGYLISTTISAPIYLICAQQTKERIGGAHKNKNNAIFDHLILHEYYVQIDSIRYPRDS